MNAPDPALAQEVIAFTLNGESVEALAGETLIEVADRPPAAASRPQAWK
jgi:hypothetical protein